jgi:sec-independent protein translocase protein TatB
MFDVSFSELVVIFFVALMVIGPEKLPKVAKVLGKLTGQAQHYISKLKEEIEREEKFKELQKIQREIKKKSIKS